MTGGDRGILAVTALTALVLPLSARAYVSHRLEHTLEPTLASATGESADIGDVYVGLSGSVTFTDVDLIGIAKASSIDASVSLSSLLAGRLSADELRVRDPVVSLRLFENGDSNLARVLRRVTAQRGERDSARSKNTRRTKLRRIVADGGSLAIQIDDRGEARVDTFELIPTPSGVRAVLGRSTFRVGSGPFLAQGSFERAGLDINVARGEISRLLATGGVFEVAATETPARVLQMSEAHVEQGIEDTSLRFSGKATENGRSGHLDIELTGGASRGGLKVYADLNQAPLGWLTPLVAYGVDTEGAVGSGTLSAQMVPYGEATMPQLTVDLALDTLHINHQAVAAAPFVISPIFKGSLGLRTTPKGRELSLEDGVLVLGDLSIAAQGVMGVSAQSLLPQTFVGSVQVAEIDCQRALHSLPAPLADPLAGMALAGTFRASIALGFDRGDPDNATLRADIPIEGCRVIAEPALANVRQLDGPIEHRLGDGRTRSLDRRAADYVALGKLPRYVSHGFVAAEDGQFFRHDGFDARQILRSLMLNVSEQELLRGGSTISQQLVKNLYLTRKRTLARKIVEAVLTWRLESVQPKELILERYINLLELGPDIYGLTAASEHWFGIRPESLSIKQAALLIAMTPEPSSMSRRILAAGGIDAQTQHRIEVILSVMRRARLISPQERERALRESLTLVPTQVARIEAAP